MYVNTAHIQPFVEGKMTISPNICFPSQRLIFLCSWEHECAVLFGRCTSIRQKPNSYLPLQGLQKSSQTFDHQVIHISTQHVKESPFTKAPLKLYIDMDTMSWFILFLWMRWKSIIYKTKNKMGQIHVEYSVMQLFHTVQIVILSFEALVNQQSLYMWI